jgi:hypothetical protein
MTDFRFSKGHVCLPPGRGSVLLVLSRQFRPLPRERARSRFKLVEAGRLGAGNREVSEDNRLSVTPDWSDEAIT